MGLTDFFSGMNLGGSGGLGTVMNMVYVFVIGVVVFGALGVCFYYLVWRYRKFPIEAIIQIPSGKAGYLYAQDRIGNLTKKGVQKVIMEKDKKAIVPSTVYKHILRSIKGKPIVYLRKIDEVTYVPLDITSSGMDIDFKPLPMSVRNMVARQVIEDAKQFSFQDALTKYAQPILYGLLIMGLVITTVINSKTLDKATTVAAEINSQANENGKEIAKNQRETTAAMGMVADMIKAICGNDCANLRSSTGLTPQPLPPLPEKTAANNINSTEVIIG